MIDIPGLIVDEKDQKDFNKYIYLKGKYLYLHVLEIFKDCFKEETFNYKEISSYIRYDKSLRKILYGYLAYIEEFWRAELLRKENNFKLYFDLIEAKTSLNELISMLKEKKLINQNKVDELIQIKELRNDIMHHNLLLANKFKKWKNIESNIDKVKEKIKLIYKNLPTDYQKSFIKSLNNLIKSDTNFTKINLGVLNYE